MEIPSELIAAKKLVEWTILALPGVVGVGIEMREENGELFDELAVRVYVADKSSIPSGIPEVVGGVGVCIVESLIEPIAQDNSRYNPLVGGIKIEKPLKGFGTLGAVVQDSSTGELLGLSNFHVVGDKNAVFPDTIWQPQAPPLIAGSPTPPNDNIGSVIRVDFPQTQPLPFSPILAGLTDSAVFKLTPALNQGRTLSSNIVDQVDRIVATDFPVIGSLVSKRGCTTRLTEGIVLASYLTVQWTAGPLNAFLLEQAEVTSTPTNPGMLFCDKGDSGSVILNKNSATAVGLLWAQSYGGTRGIMSFISNVQSQLGVNIAWI